MRRTAQTTKLQLGRDGGGPRHFIGDVAIHAGDPIAAEIDGQWYDGRYEGNWSGGRSLEEIRAGVPSRAELTGFFYFVDKFGNERCRRIDVGAAVRLSDGQRYTP